MNVAFVSHERDREQNEHYNQDDALFIFRELDNAEQGFHFFT
jgi:hypothetical protein